MIDKAKNWIQEKLMDALAQRVDMDEDGKVELAEVLVVGAELAVTGLHVLADTLAAWAASERSRLAGSAPKKWVL